MSLMVPAVPGVDRENGIQAQQTMLRMAKFAFEILIVHGADEIDPTTMQALQKV